MRVHGSCHCGAIRYEAEVDPDQTMICHCSDCQALSATAFRVNVPAKAADFRLLQGKPKEYVKVGDSGARRAQGFCENCGSQLYATAAEQPRAAYMLRTGAIEEWQRGVLLFSGSGPQAEADPQRPEPFLKGEVMLFC